MYMIQTQFGENCIFKPGAWACSPHIPSFSSTNIGVYVSTPRALIISHVKGMHNNLIRQFYGFSFLHMTLVVYKMNGRGLSNTAHHEHLSKKAKVTWY